MVEQKMMKSFDELKFSDDFMFGKVMEDKELCREVLECLLQRPVGKLQEVQTQKGFKFTSDGKPIRLDVYNEDDSGIIYDSEMQNLNNHSIAWFSLPKRSRFYQASIDIDYLDKGENYDTLPECNVMFICTFDPFKKGLCQYTFRERCDEFPDMTLDDGTVKRFYNCCYEGDDIPQDLKEFYDYVRSGRTGEGLTEKIDKAVINGRMNEAWRSQYMKERLVIYDAQREEREKREKAEKRADEEKKRADEEKKRADEAVKLAQEAKAENAVLRKKIAELEKSRTV